MSALANKFGCKAVTIVGSVIACAAYFISTYSNSVDVLILTYGALGGQSVYVCLFACLSICFVYICLSV